MTRLRWRIGSVTRPCSHPNALPVRPTLRYFVWSRTDSEDTAAEPKPVGWLPVRLPRDHRIYVTVIGLEQHLRDVSIALSELMERNPDDSGMGTTVAGIVIHQNGVVSFNVGDSRVYRRCDGYLRQISTDDRPPLQQRDEPSSSSSIVTQALGGSVEDRGITPHVTVEPIRDGALYLLCTDGLTDTLDLDTIESHITGDDLASVVALFDRTIAAGAPDNVSIVIVRIASESRT